MPRRPIFADGVCFVSLADLRRANDVPAAIVTALAMIVLSGESPEQALERFLAAKDLLLVVDNFEHLLDATPFVARLLEACPAITILATSREPLNLRAEERYVVAPLALPEREKRATPNALAGIDAVALFGERARAHDPAFRLGDDNAAAVAEICRRMDGLPLAIELAAARCGLLSPSELAERLDGAMRAGARDAPARQRTLRATMDWSHGLLSDAEQQCFARFAVFAGGATVDAAQVITGADLETVDGLVAKNLFGRRHHPDGSTRLLMLETIRSYAAERLAVLADHEAVRERHYCEYLEFAHRHGDERALYGARSRQHLAGLDAEIHNLHAALGWAIGQADAERALEMCAALGSYWLMRSRHADAMERVDQALDLPGADALPALCVRVLTTKARCLWPLGREAEVPAVGAAAEGIARRLCDPVLLSQTLRLRAMSEIGAERLDVAEVLADEALHWATVAGDRWEIAEASRAKAIAASSTVELRERVQTAASRLSDVGNLQNLASLLTTSAYAALCLGGDHDAADFAARATPIARDLDNRFTWIINKGNVGLVALLAGDPETALHAFREELAFSRDTVVRPLLFEALRGLAAVASVHGKDARAATLVGAAGAHRYGRVIDPLETRLDQTYFEPARTRYGADRWDDAAREGGALSFEDAIAYALEEPRADPKPTGQTDSPT
jgi:predicted ATPase